LYIPILALLSALSEADIGELRGYLEFSAAVSKPLELAISYYQKSVGVFHPKAST